MKGKKKEKRFQKMRNQDKTQDYKRRHEEQVDKMRKTRLKKIFKKLNNKEKDVRERNKINMRLLKHIASCICCLYSIREK